MSRILSRWSPFVEQIRADRPFYLAIMLYLDIAVCLVLYYDKEPAGPLWLIVDMLVSTVVITVHMSIVWLGIHYWRALRQGHALFDVLIEAINPAAFARFLMLPALFAFLSAFNAVKVILPDYTDLNFDRTLSNFDRSIHGTDPWRLLTFFYQPSVLNVIQALYLPFWTYVLLLVSAYVLISERTRALRSQYIIVFLLMWSFLGNVVAAMYMSDGPAFFGHVTGDFQRYGGLLNALSQTRDVPFSAYVIQNSLWLLHQTHHASEGSGISAFPSLHVAVATLMCLTLSHIKPRYALYGVPYLVTILLGSIVLGWHYAVDGYASIILVCALWAMVANLLKAHRMLDSGERGSSAMIAGYRFLAATRQRFKMGVRGRAGASS